MSFAYFSPVSENPLELKTHPKPPLFSSISLGVSCTFMHLQKYACPLMTLLSQWWLLFFCFHNPSAPGSGGLASVIFVLH